ncbi:hypothetical protein HZH66_005579 [Vespula vulgaris]|uniref:Uncharacterized protein n=1 Tax=Vespula vulgaris TaxID=7454 RepID=A0A834N865_VESVU|nr:hypothetical protein HZH66_005579 [Vespula vulgaris]
MITDEIVGTPLNKEEDEEEEKEEEEEEEEEDGKMKKTSENDRVGEREEANDDGSGQKLPMRNSHLRGRKVNFAVDVGEPRYCRGSSLAQLFYSLDMVAILFTGERSTKNVRQSLP